MIGVKVFVVWLGQGSLEWSFLEPCNVCLSRSGKINLIGMYFQLLKSFFNLDVEKWSPYCPNFWLIVGHLVDSGIGFFFFFFHHLSSMVWRIHNDMQCAHLPKGKMGSIFPQIDGVMIWPSDVYIYIYCLFIMVINVWYLS